MLFLALQSVNVASIIIAAQTFDSMLITIFKGTCGLGVSPGGWFCVSASSAELTGNSPFSSDDYFIFTFGFLLTGVMVIPLGFFSLVENIAVQMTSFIVLTAILIQWTVAFVQEGLKTELLPAAGSNSTMVLGIVIFNYSFITTIPSWVNSLKPDVNIHKCMWVSVVISTIFYLLLGIFGAMAYQMDASSDILAILSSQGSTASLVTSYLFPVCALVTSIPVFTIVIRSNLLRGEICSPSWALFWSNFLPWFICIPLQTKDWVGTIQNWSSLFFQSTVNFILPFVLYFVSRKYVASVEPIMDEKDQNSLYPNEKNLSAIQPSIVFPSPILQNPDNNDVRMFNPDDNYSISIRRSSIRPSKHSQMEQSMIAHSPLMDKNGLPIIVYSDITSNNADVVSNSPIISRSPNTWLTPGQRQQRHPSPSASSQTVHTAGSTNGLGISNPNSENDSNINPPLYNSKDNNDTSKNNNLLSPSSNFSSAPGSPRIFNNSAAKNDDSGVRSPRLHQSPNMGGLTATAPQSPEISQASSILNPPVRSFQPQTHHSSMLASALSFKSPIVAPDTQSLENENTLSKEELEHEKNRFIAFQPKSWFNPFYLAIVSCGALGISILFMIIFDLTLLGLGKDVFA
ncbi:unnamed protein product [Mucor hiemalis]